MSLKIIDYIGYCNKEKIPTGHIIKTLNDFSNLLKSSLDVELIIPKIYKEYIDYNNIKYIDIDMSNIGSKKNINYIKYILKKIRILIKLLNDKNNKEIWFINTDFWLFLVIYIMPIKKYKRIYATNYIDYTNKNGIKGKLLKNVYNNALKKIEKIFTTNRQKEDKKNLFIPDYFYDKSSYDIFLRRFKQERVLCVGSMNEGKDLKGMITSFNKNKIKLDIIGNIKSTEEFNNLKSLVNENITIKNCRLLNNEYYETINSYRWSILPYKASQYMGRSSGVILENAFLGTGIICPKFLLEFTGLRGIGYENINELEHMDFNDINKLWDNIVEYNSEYIKQYDKNIIKNKLINEFKKK